jgi:carbamoyl-phosphate synthase small subunit
MGVRRAVLVLADGTVFEGGSFGAEGEAVGEVVFNTAMTGYQEILTDPSYTGQIVTMTYTQMGNYGVSPGDEESAGGPKVEGFVVKEHLGFHSNWRSEGPLSEYLVARGIVAIEGIDTRALTRHLREGGSQMGVISTEAGNPGALWEKVRAHPGIGGIDLASRVTTEKPYDWSEPLWSGERAGGPHKRVVVYDFGVKVNILRHLYTSGFDVHVVPADMPAEAVIELKPDGIMFSNGPGDPEAVTTGIEAARKIVLGKGGPPCPVMGICLGHQILGLALGGRTYKLKFGHHGGNHPVMDLGTGRVEITSQNHNFCVDVGGLGDKVRLTHRNLYDNTEEGMAHAELPVFSVQYHPEAGPGPNDAAYLFERFRKLVG